MFIFLKSNMDRFIATKDSYNFLLTVVLKSNMDRFIGFIERQIRSRTEF